MSVKPVHSNLQMLQQQFSIIHEAWLAHRDSINTEPSTQGVQFSKKEFEESIFSIQTFLESDEASLLFNPLLAAHFVRHNQINNQVQNLKGQLAAVSGNPGHWPGISDHFFALLQSLNFIFSFSSKMIEDSNLNSEILQKVGLANISFRKAEEQSASIISNRDRAAALLLESETMLNIVKDLNEKISKELTQLEAFKEGLNRKGLGEAFATRAIKLESSLTSWIAAFVLCIVIISVLTIGPSAAKVFKEFHVESAQAAEKSVNIVSTTRQTDNTNHLVDMLMRVLMCSPLIWIAWFSAKQYSISKRLKEEYEFKAATAMTYYGYQNAASSSPEMLELLLTGAIKNFHERPDVAFDGSRHEVSPIEKLLQQMINKVEPAELLKSINNLVKK